MMAWPAKMGFREWWRVEINKAPSLGEKGGKKEQRGKSRVIVPCVTPDDHPQKRGESFTPLNPHCTRQDAGRQIFIARLQ